MLVTSLKSAEGPFHIVWLGLVTVGAPAPGCCRSSEVPCKPHVSSSFGHSTDAARELLEI